MIDVSAAEFLLDVGMKASGGLGLIMLGRWLLRAQIIASLFRTAGVVIILLGVGSLLGVIHVDVAAVIALLDRLLEVTT